MAGVTAALLLPQGDGQEYCSVVGLSIEPIPTTISRCLAAFKKIKPMFTEATPVVLLLAVKYLPIDRGTIHPQICSSFYFKKRFLVNQELLEVF